jgi:hypothetical protein
LFVAVSIALGACSARGVRHSAAGRRGERTGETSTTAAPALTAFTVAAADVPGAGALPDDVRAGVSSTLDRYLQAGLVQTLRTGAAPPELAQLFTAAATTRLGGPDRAALVDEGMAPHPDAEATSATADLTGLREADSSISVVAADIVAVVRAGRGAEAVQITRRGQLVLVPDTGTWKIDGYDLKVERDPLVPQTTSTAPPTSQP